MPVQITLADAIEKRINRTAGCWLWTGQRDKDGYGRLSRRPKNIVIHRWMYETHVGPIAENECVCHACDNPSCVNPAHLFTGTNWDNKNDSVQKDRHTKGRLVGTATLTDELVIQILISTDTIKNVAKQFGIHFATVAKIRRRECWKHVMPNFTPDIDCRRDRWKRAKSRNI